MKGRRKTVSALGRSAAVLAAFAGLLVAGLAGRAQAPAAPAALRIAYLPVLGKDETVKRYAPLTAHLARELGAPVTAVSFSSYREMVRSLVTERYEISYLSPAAYATASSLVPLEVVAIELSEAGERGYYSVIISRSDGKVRTLEDGRGQVLAFTEQSSASGFMAPLNHFLHDLGQTPGTFAGKVVFAGDRRAVIKGVLDGAYDLGATNNLELNYTLKEENIPADTVRVLWKSDLIPGSPVCVQPGLAPELKQKILAALLSFSQNQEAVKSLGIGGYARADNKDLEIARKLYTAPL
jgi:phosphonate transport system substrate-binding protein